MAKPEGPARKPGSLAIALALALGAAAQGGGSGRTPPGLPARAPSVAGDGSATAARVGGSRDWGLQTNWRGARAEGEVSTQRFAGLEARRGAEPRSAQSQGSLSGENGDTAPRSGLGAVRPTGKLVRVRGTAPPSGPGTVKRVLIEVEQGLPVDPQPFAAAVQAILYDSRGWAAGGRVAFRRVDAEPADFEVVLASPPTTDRLCAPLETSGRYSCHQDGRVILNFWRWRHGARAYEGDLALYRTYLVNHEIGHALGHSWHRACPRPGARAPVMMQQTIGVELCRPRPWPLPVERASLP